jgi:hypothetical protein
MLETMSASAPLDLTTCRASAIRADVGHLVGPGEP